MNEQTYPYILMGITFTILTIGSIIAYRRGDLTIEPGPTWDQWQNQHLIQPLQLSITESEDITKLIQEKIDQMIPFQQFPEVYCDLLSATKARDLSIKKTNQLKLRLEIYQQKEEGLP